MSGYGPAKKPPGKQSVGRRRSDDPCDLMFRTDLVGVRAAIRDVREGDMLRVELQVVDSARSVVCKPIKSDQILGTLAAFQGLAQLIKCLTQENRYIADVESVSRTQCTVLVRRESQ